MKKVLGLVFISLCMVQIVFAGEMTENRYGTQFIKDDGTYAKSEWITFDGDFDGLTEYYYFDEQGYMLSNRMTPDGYMVNEDGQWIENGRVKKLETLNENTFNNIKQLDVSQTNIVRDINGDNTEDVKNNPNTLPPKVKQAIEQIIFWCNEDQDIVVPYSKRLIRELLKIKGYKNDVIDRAIDECNVSWNDHALILAKIYLSKNYGIGQIRDMLKASGFSEASEIQYALTHMNSLDGKKYVNPNDFEGMTYEQKLIKLQQLGFDNDKIEQAMAFIESVE